MTLIQRQMNQLLNSAKLLARWSVAQNYLQKGRLAFKTIVCQACEIRYHVLFERIDEQFSLSPEPLGFIIQESVFLFGRLGLHLAKNISCNKFLTLELVLFQLSNKGLPMVHLKIYIYNPPDRENTHTC